MSLKRGSRQGFCAASPAYSAADQEEVCVMFGVHAFDPVGRREDEIISRRLQWCQVARIQPNRGLRGATDFLPAEWWGR